MEESERKIDDHVGTSDYQEYVRQRSLNAVLIKSAMVSGAWLVVCSIALVVAILVRPGAGVVGMDPAGREHVLVLVEPPSKEVGATR